MGGEQSGEVQSQLYHSRILVAVVVDVFRNFGPTIPPCPFSLLLEISQTPSLQDLLLEGTQEIPCLLFPAGGGAENTVIPHALTMCQVLRVCDSVRFSQFYNSHSFLLMEMGRKKREVKLLAQGHTASKREVGFELPTWFALPPCSPIPAELLWLEGHGQIDPLALWSQGSQ